MVGRLRSANFSSPSVQSLTVRPITDGFLQDLTADEKLRAFATEFNPK